MNWEIGIKHWVSRYQRNKSDTFPTSVRVTGKKELYYSPETEVFNGYSGHNIFAQRVSSVLLGVCLLVIICLHSPELLSVKITRHPTE